jgi:hypothetical protein
VNTGASWPDLDQAWLRVRQMQRKLHQWATEDSVEVVPLVVELRRRSDVQAAVSV